ncbi:hypothetical protein Tco_0029398, partial [Tanacetum coccineum]
VAPETSTIAPIISSAAPMVETTLVTCARWLNRGWWRLWGVAMVVWCSVVMEYEGGDVAVDGVASWGEGGEAVEVRVVVRRCDSGDGGG